MVSKSDSSASIAFLPWVSIEEPMFVGELRLSPYERGISPGNIGHVLQADIDSVLAAYAERPNHPVRSATLLEFGTYELGSDCEPLLTSLFRARELLAFAALANRRLFRRSEYCNFDTYALTVQRYKSPHQGAFAFSTRRRDGGTQYLWDTDEFAFLKPLHVNANAVINVDQKVLAALLRADSEDRLCYESVVEFNRANTDSSDVPMHVEIVMMKSAFEWFFGIGHNVSEFAKALGKCIPLPTHAPEGRLSMQWRQRWPNSKRLLDAWAREFCAIRGSAAHGKQRDVPMIWSHYAHLAFAAVLFPLLMKQSLAQQGFLNIEFRDAAELEILESYIAFDPFDPKIPQSGLGEHPWSLLYTDQVMVDAVERSLASGRGNDGE
jgi:hypothetical protein